jgi:S-methylmethionine-dependent homocysteine/selenocysteine methylase
MIVLLDGPMGTELQRRGADTSGRAWSARALTEQPDLVCAIHRDYAAAGATVHTANTFRTRPGDVGEAWQALTATAVRLALASVPAQHRVFGSMAPIEDCYRPDLSPPDAEAQHRPFAQALARAGVHGLLVETHAHPDEALAASRAALATGLPTWLALTAGYTGTLMTPVTLRATAERAVDLGVQAVLVNCTPADATLPFVEALQGLGAPVGAYANAGHPDHGVGWTPSADGPERYAIFADAWVDAGATILGGCCGTTDAHLRALAARPWRTASHADNR